MMKKVVYGALAGLILTFIALNVGSFTGSAPCFAYVYSGSMEPTIRINDGFIVLPSREYKPGDIIFYRPVRLDAEIVTHRIVAAGKSGFVTKGDNVPASDQSAGEPEVGTDRIIGKVLSLGGKPFIIPGMGRFAADLQSRFGAFSKIVPLITVAMAAVLFLWDLMYPNRKTKSKKRWKLGDLYLIAAAALFCIAVLSTLLGSETVRIRYLVSENPGTLTDAVRLGETGTVPVQLKNSGFLPVWHISEGIGPLKVSGAPAWLPPGAVRTAGVIIPPHPEPGWYKGYIRVYNLPMILPREIFACLCGWGILAVLSGTCLSLLFWIGLFVWIAERIPGMEGWIPLRALRDRAGMRRLRRIRYWMLGRRRR